MFTKGVCQKEADVKKELNIVETVGNAGSQTVSLKFLSKKKKKKNLWLSKLFFCKYCFAACSGALCKKVPLKEKPLDTITISQSELIYWKTIHNFYKLKFVQDHNNGQFW